MEKILLIGYEGFIGNTIYNLLKDKFNVIGISKDSLVNDDDFDFIINANGNSKRYWANNNPFEDFELSTTSVYKSIIKWKYKNYIYISSIEAEYSSNYGFNKSLAESIVKYYGDFHNYVIIRPSLVIGKGMKKGVIKDIIDNNEVYLTKESRLQLITNTEIAKLVLYVINNIEKFKNQIINAYGKRNISVEEIGNKLNRNIRYVSTLRNENYQRETSYIKGFNFKTTEEYLQEVINERMG